MICIWIYFEHRQSLKGAPEQSECSRPIRQHHHLPKDKRMYLHLRSLIPVSLLRQNLMEHNLMDNRRIMVKDSIQGTPTSITIRNHNISNSSTISNSNSNINILRRHS